MKKIPNNFSHYFIKMLKLILFTLFTTSFCYDERTFINMVINGNISIANNYPAYSNTIDIILWTGDYDTLFLLVEKNIIQIDYSLLDKLPPMQTIILQDKLGICFPTPKKYMNEICSYENYGMNAMCEMNRYLFFIIPWLILLEYYISVLKRENNVCYCILALWFGSIIVPFIAILMSIPPIYIIQILLE